MILKGFPVHYVVSLAVGKHHVQMDGITDGIGVGPRFLKKPATHDLAQDALISRDLRTESLSNLT